MSKSRATVRQTVLCAVIVLFVGIPAVLAKPAKNVILMISDGAGFNAFYACSYYQHGKLGKQPYDQPGFVKYGCTHSSLNSSGAPRGYDAVKIWSDPVYLKTATDSAAAATALNTGVKTRNGQICTDFHRKELITFAQIADRLGKSTGTITTVPLSHATPACVWAHNETRKNYAAIANEMIFGSGLDVIMGAGNPDYNNDGQPEKMDAQYVGGTDTWQALLSNATGKGWSLIQTKNEFEAVAQKSGPLPARLIGVAQVNTSMQCYRSGTDPAPAAPFNANVPDLKTMAVAAINVLSQNEKGFYLMIEGGAVDSANHRNNLPRMIEEQTDFNRAVEAVVQWIESSSSWDETLLIITADHECGMIWGPKTFTDVNQNGRFDTDIDTFNGFQPLVNNGPGVLPGVQYGHKGHTNALVPLYARGPGSERFADLVDGTDTKAGEFWDFSGQYVDNTDVFIVMRRALESDPLEEAEQTILPFVPGSWTLVILPDIQHYANQYPGLLNLQTRWILDNRNKYNIEYVLQNGDLTHRNKPIEWQRVDKAFKILDDASIPYALVPGNHDYSQSGRAKDRSTLMNDYFSPKRFKKWKAFGGVMEAGHMENNYHLFKAKGQNWLILGLEWGPRDAALTWADTVLQKHANRRAIVLTHAYLYSDSTRYDWQTKGTEQEWNPHKYDTEGGVNDGEEIWNKLIKNHANVVLVINGHVLHDGLGFQVSSGDQGNRVNEMLVNYQKLDVGGGGWLRLLEFQPDGKTVQAKTYSPLYDLYNTSPDNQFTFTID